MSEWTTVSDGTAEVEPEVKIVFEEYGDEYIGEFLGYRNLTDRESGQSYKQARFREEDGTICYTLEIREARNQTAGDIGICAACGMIMIFTGFGNMVRKPTETEAKLIGANEEVMQIRDAILQRLVKAPPDMV